MTWLCFAAELGQADSWEMDGWWERVVGGHEVYALDFLSRWEYSEQQCGEKCYMIEPVRADWTIVVVGKWNVAIFNPSWLSANVFEKPELGVEVNLEPELPRRITGDKVTLIPSYSRLILAPADLEEGTLMRMEQVACSLLRILEHTPVSAVGINFAYRIAPASTDLLTRLPSLYSQDFAHEELMVKSREFKWTLEHEGHDLNVSSRVSVEEIFIKFNFHTRVKDAVAARKCIDGKVSPYSIKARSLLEQVFGVILENN